MSFGPITPELGADAISGLLTILGISTEKSLADEIKRLYKEADSLAVLTVRVTAALLWWASHIASAAADANGYGQQIQAALKKADANTLAAWQEWLNVKYPADLRKLYSDLSGQIGETRKAIPKVHKVNLKPIEAEIVALEKWKKVTVTPELKSWLTFAATWKHTYQPALHTLLGWLHKPITLADFLALPLIGALPAYLHKPAARTGSTAIAAALAATWANDPDVIYDAVLDWLVAA